MTRRTRVVLAVMMLLASGLACEMPDIGLSTGPTATPTVPPSTPTPVPSPTPPPSPTSPPPPTIDAGPEDVAAALMAVELPPGAVPETYMEIPADQMGLTSEMLSTEEFTVSKVLLYLSEENLELLMGMLFPLGNTAQQVLFDSAISDPDLLVDSLVTGMAGEGAEVTEIGPIPGLEGIGDSAAGYGFTYSAEGMTMRIDVVVFRRGAAGAMAAVMYMEGRTPQMPVARLSRVIDEQIEEALR